MDLRWLDHLHSLLRGMWDFSSLIFSKLVLFTKLLIKQLFFLKLRNVLSLTSQKPTIKCKKSKYRSYQKISFILICKTKDHLSHHINMFFVKMYDVLFFPQRWLWTTILIKPSCHNWMVKISSLEYPDEGSIWIVGSMKYLGRRYISTIESCCTAGKRIKGIKEKRQLGIVLYLLISRWSHL